MKIIHQLFLLSLIAALNLSLAWECSKKCDGYDQCRREQNRARELSNHAVDFMSSSMEDDEHEDDTHVLDNVQPPMAMNLRGNNATSRQLQSSHFQIKMHWEQHYCWQAESRERKWCWECRGSCSSDNIVEIDKCDSGESEQRWTYKSLGGGKVRISPKSRSDLCVENRGGVMKLKSCDDNDSKQRLSGFKSSSKFELYVNGDDSKLISQGHDPKRHEKLELVKKSTARGDHTNFWEVYNPSTSGSSGSSGGPSPTPQTNNGGTRPRRQFKGPDHCTPRNPCSLCEGDCDNNNDCEGRLVCRQRDAFESFRQCSGGSTDSSESDYCVWP